MSQKLRLTDNDIDRIWQLAGKGLRVQEIMERTGRSRRSVWRVLSGRRRKRPLRNGNTSNGQHGPKLLGPPEPLSLGTRIDSSKSAVEDTMPTAELIRNSFVEPLRVHYSVHKPDPERFVADLVSTLLEERFSTSVLKLAVRNFIRTRRAPNFPSVADCIVVCRAAQGELRTDAASTQNCVECENASNPDRSEETGQ